MSYDTLATAVDNLAESNTSLIDTINATHEASNEALEAALAAKEAALSAIPISQNKVDAAMNSLAASDGSTKVGFKQDGAGSVTRDSQSKIREHVNVLDFGVVLGVVTTAVAESNLAAINKAVAYLDTKGGGVLNYPEGKIYIRRATGATTPAQQYIILKSGIYHKGRGKKSTTIVRYGPHTPFWTDAAILNTDIEISDMTIDGNPGLVGVTAYASNLIYIVNADGVRISNVTFKDCPGLHSVDCNGSKNVRVSKCNFIGNNAALSLEFGGATYYPESVQIGKHPDTGAPSECITVEDCSWGPSETYTAPFVAVGNHSSAPGSGFSAIDVTVRNGRAVGLQKYFVRPFAWDGVLIEDIRSISTVGMFLYLCGSNAAGVLTPSRNVTVRRVYFDGDDFFFRCDPLLLTHTDTAKFTDLTIDRCTIIGRTAINAISLYYCNNVLINATKITGAARSIWVNGIKNLRVINPDFDTHSVSGIEVILVAGAAVPSSSNVTISGGRISNCMYYAVNLASVDGFLIESTDVTGSSMLDNTRGPIIVASASQNGRVSDLVGTQNANPNQPLYVVSVTSGVNIVTNQLDVYHTGADAVINNATGKSYATKQFGFKVAAPTTGTWAKGDIIKNSAPAVGSPKGWVCTVAGTPGTWVSEGNL